MVSIHDLEEKLVSQLHLVRVGVESGPVVDRHYFRALRGLWLPDFESAVSKCGFYACHCPGDDRVAVDIPRENRENVSLADLMSTPEFQNATAEVQSENCESFSLAEIDDLSEPELQIAPATLPMILGCDPLGRPFITDLSRMWHMLIAGNNGTGKTTLLKSIARSIAARTTPEKCKFMFLNFSGGGVPDAYLAWPPITGEADAALAGLRIVVAEMERRYELLSAAGATGIDMPRLVVIIDEFSDLMAVSRSKVEKCLQKIAQKGHRVGVHMIVATAQCDAKTISGIIKANFLTRVSFHVDTAAKSRQTLGEPGAELLLPYGDALFWVAARMPVRIHTPNIEG